MFTIFFSLVNYACMDRNKGKLFLFHFMCCLRKSDISWILWCNLVKGNIVRMLWIEFWSQEGWRLFCCSCCLFCFVFFQQNSPELVNRVVTFPWCSNSVDLSCPDCCMSAQYVLYIFIFLPVSKLSEMFVSFSWRYLRCSGGSSVEWRCQWSPCAA